MKPVKEEHSDLMENLFYPQKVLLLACLETQRLKHAHRSMASNLPLHLWSCAQIWEMLQMAGLHLKFLRKVSRLMMQVLNFKNAFNNPVDKISPRVICSTPYLQLHALHRVRNHTSKDLPKSQSQVTPEDCMT